MTGTLYVIGIGPGDPELLTLKGVRIIKEAGVLCVPKGRKEGSSLALSIVEKAMSLDGKEIIEAHFPMMKTRDSGEAGKRGSGKVKGTSELDAKWNETAEKHNWSLSKHTFTSEHIKFCTTIDVKGELNKCSSKLVWGWTIKIL